MLPYEVAPSVGIHYTCLDGRVQTPLIPHFLFIIHPPERHLDNSILSNVNRLLERKYDWKPADHVWSMCLWMDAQHYVFVEDCVEIAYKARKHAGLLASEAEYLFSTSNMENNKNEKKNNSKKRLKQKSIAYKRHRENANARKSKFLDNMTPEQKEMKRLKDREYNQRKKAEKKVKTGNLDVQLNI
ncbi:unnamed protein product [Acanthoscelides obtectus]|uniref:Uncharacterized protein n=1 Tax=Acanthoscelides obtectus TaxID=200917 RepID=A0A9P0VTU5_ACAOB|nr:unnamed protein product [Acanthoscelides obtectus]CAK1650813.1 hypothetical protein AOBTE_LOCUS16910 [Acanthoscelides obtectus]